MVFVKEKKMPLYNFMNCLAKEKIFLTIKFVYRKWVLVSFLDGSPKHIKLKVHYVIYSKNIKNTKKIDLSFFN